MKLTEANPGESNAIRGYSAGRVRIGARILAASLIVSADRLIEVWSARSVEALAPADFEAVFQLAPEIVVLGTGETQRFAPAAVRRAFVERGIGLECMDLGAACRTFNVLLQEGRRVVAALVIESSLGEDTGRESSIDQPIIRS
jgi:uncharacterized protein